MFQFFPSAGVRWLAAGGLARLGRGDISRPSSHQIWSHGGGGALQLGLVGHNNVCFGLKVLE